MKFLSFLNKKEDILDVKLNVKRQYPEFKDSFTIFHVEDGWKERCILLQSNENKPFNDSKLKKEHIKGKNAIVDISMIEILINGIQHEYQHDWLLDNFGKEVCLQLDTANIQVIMEYMLNPDIYTLMK